MNYIGTTFSPAMVSPDAAGFHGEEKTSAEMIQICASCESLTSVVGHANTARVLTKKLGIDVAFNRANVTLASGDVLLSAIPQFRVDETREYTDTEVADANFRYFKTVVL
jgi:hypothetical protein